MNYLDQLLAMESMPGPGPERTEALRKMKARHKMIEDRLNVEREDERKLAQKRAAAAINKSAKEGFEPEFDFSEDELVLESMNAAYDFIATEGVNNDSIELVKDYGKEMEAYLAKIKRFKKAGKLQEALDECDEAIETYNKFRAEINALTADQNVTEVVLGNILHVLHFMLYKFLLFLPIFGHVTFIIEASKDIKHILETIKKLTKGGVKLEDLNMCTSTAKMGLDIYGRSLNSVRRQLVVLMEEDK